MRKVMLAAGLLACGIFASAASAGVVVRVSKARQSMYVYVNGQLAYVWPVRRLPGAITPPTASITRQASIPTTVRAATTATMPYSIFSSADKTIHGSYDIGHLGYPASHGCIRLHPQHAERALRTRPHFRQHQDHCVGLLRRKKSGSCIRRFAGDASSSPLSSAFLPRAKAGLPHRDA